MEDAVYMKCENFFVYSTVYSRINQSVPAKGREKEKFAE